MKKIFLGGKYGNTAGNWALVDDEDVNLTDSFKWRCLKIGLQLYASRLFRDKNGKQRTAYMHRDIMGVTDRKILVDHSDYNGLNNQRANLRIATKSENMRNRPKRSLNNEGKMPASKYKGVSLDHGRWASEIHKNYKKIWLGRYDTEIEAARAYDEAAKEHHGEFAMLNFPN